MMISWRTTLVAALALISPRAFGQETPLTLSESIRRALESGAQVKVSEETVTGAEARVEESRSIRYPQLNIQASYTRLGPLSSYEMSMGPMFPPVKMTFGVEDSYNGSLALQYNIFDWGRSRAGVRTADFGVDVSRSSLRLAQLSTGYQVVQVFYGILTAAEALRVNDESIGLLEKNVAIARRRYESGLASAYDVRSIEVQLSSTRARRIETENVMRKLDLLFNRLLGRPLNEPVRLDGTLSYTPVSINADSLVRVALARRPEAESTVAQEQMARAQSEMTRTYNKPVLNLSASWGFRNGMFPNVNALRANYVAGLSLAYPVFDGFRTESQVEQSEVNIRSAQVRRQDIVPAIELDVRQAVTELLTAQERLGVDELKVTQAREALRIAQERYERGMLSTVELLDSQTALENARLGYLQSVGNCITGTYAIHKATGMPLP